jgi:transposase
MDQYGYIRTARRVYGTSIRQIARETGHSRATIRKVLRKEPCGYSPRRQQPYRVLGPHLDSIEMWLEGDKERPRKQRHTARRIYDRLVTEQGFGGSETTVRRYVRGAKVRLGVGGAKAFIPLEPDMGQEAEVDWGTALAVISGEEARYKVFCMRSRAYSGASRPPIPLHSGHLFRSIPATRSIPFRPPIPEQAGHPLERDSGAG